MNCGLSSELMGRKMKKEIRNQFSMGKPKSMVNCCLISCGLFVYFVGVLFLPVNAFSDTYKLVNTRFIPWGYQTGQIPSPGNGPGFFHFDDNGDLYLYCFDNKQYTLIKYGPQENEVGRIQLDCPAQRVKVEPNKIFMVCGYRNEIIYVDKNLTSIKKIKIPKDFAASESKFDDGVLYRQEFDKKSGDRDFTFDEDEYVKAGSPKKGSKLKSNLDYVDQITTNGEILSLKKPSGELINIWESNGLPVRDISRIEDDKFSNLYFDISYSYQLGVIEDSVLLKVSPDGKTLATLQFQPDDIVNSYCGNWGIPLDVDRNGNVYRMRTNKDGVLIDKWSD